MKKQKILVVDDEKDLALGLTKLLCGLGYDANCVFDGQAAIKELKNNPPHLMILDLRMPKMDGLEVLEELKELGKRVKVLILTAYGNIDTAVQSVKMGVAHYLQKPFKHHELIALVQKEIGLPESDDEEKNLYKEIGEKLKKARTQKNLTLKMLGEQAGLSVSLLSQIEHAKISPSLATLFKLSKTLKIPLKSMF